jgi:hypothetical protein
MNVDQIIQEINDSTAPAIMSKRAAKDFLEEVLSHVECQLDAMGDEED